MPSSHTKRERRYLCQLALKSQQRSFDSEMSGKDADIDPSFSGAAAADPRPVSIAEMSMEELKRVQKTLFIRITRRFNASRDLSRLILYGLAKLVDEAQECSKLEDELRALGDRAQDILKQAGKSKLERDKYGCLVRGYYLKLSEYTLKVQVATELFKGYGILEADFDDISDVELALSEHEDNVSRKSADESYGQAEARPQYADNSKCLLCKETHEISNCRMFKAMSTSRKYSVLRRYNLCFKCLKAGHLAANCLRKQECGVKGCKATHHPLLHPEPKEVASERTSKEKEIYSS